MRYSAAAIAASLSALTLSQVATTPAHAQAATEAEAKSAATFIDTLAGEAFDVIRAGDPSSPATKTKLRGMLAENFDVNYIGQYLIRRHKKVRSPGRSISGRICGFSPTWVVATYTNNLFAFDDCRRLMSFAPCRRGTRGDLKVYSARQTEVRFADRRSMV